MINSKVDYPEPSELLPHEKPMLLIRKILDFKCGNYILSETWFDSSDYFYMGHFTGNPITPGVILLEAMFQTSGLYLKLERKISENSEIKGRAVKIKAASFLKEVKPNERLQVKAKLNGKVMDFFVFHCEIRSAGQLVCKSEVVLI